MVVACHAVHSLIRGDRCTIQVHRQTIYGGCTRNDVGGALYSWLLADAWRERRAGVLTLLAAKGYCPPSARAPKAAAMGALRISSRMPVNCSRWMRRLTQWWSACTSMRSGADKSRPMSDASGTFDVMTAETWHPLSARESGKAAGLREGVPTGLEWPLRNWIFRASFSCPVSSILRLPVLLDFQLRLSDLQVGDESGENLDNRMLAFCPDTSRLLDITDGLLRMLPNPTVPMTADLEKSRTVLRLHGDLQQLLDDARSVYRVNMWAKRLERRVDPLASKLAAEAVSAAKGNTNAGDAARQLSEAADKISALHPEADQAYALAIKAVESAAHAIIEPNNRKATLGTMLGILKSNPTAFEAEIAGPDRSKGSVAPVAAMMRMLWDGQTSRHGSKEPTRNETPAEAEMAVQLASVLVLWFTTNKVHKRP